MGAFRRTVIARTQHGRSGGLIATASVDDWFHDFQVSLELHGDEVTHAEARSFRHPWNTCPGALSSVTMLDGPAHLLGPSILAAPRDTTCVHVNDLVWLASHRHPERRYEIEVTPAGATLGRDGRPMLDWKLHHWEIAGTGRLSGLAISDPRWTDRLDEIDATFDVREAVKVLRRAILVAIGYYTLDWDRIERGTDVPGEVMAGTCHTFSAGRVSSAVCLVDVPERRSRPRGADRRAFES
ncbi:MAG: hypothetical protein HYX32_12030 [Actinobacteria bacterium]|nr:hypothetical protein [Actinomycetota bacterium]